MTHQSTVQQPITQVNLELVLTRSTGCFGLLLYLLALPDVLVQIPVTTIGLDLMLIASIPAAITWSMLVSPGPWQRVSTGTAALLMILSFVLWHLGVIGTGSHAASSPWSYGISGLGIALAAVAFRTTWAGIYSALFCLAILLVPVTSAGNARNWKESSQDALLGAVSAIVIIAPMTALRRAAKNSDEAAGAAMREAAAATQAKALGAQRTRLDSLTHDTVMAALNVATQAQSAEVMDAAAQAARDAILQLDELQTGPDDEGKSSSPDELVSRLRTATAAYDTKISYEHADPEGQLIPAAVSQALIQATAEAVRNSSLHAAGPSDVMIRFSTEDRLPSISIQVTDEGPGFNPQNVNPKRLGIRVSIVRRMKDISGEATIHSRPGAGTRIHLRWRGARNDD